MDPVLDKALNELYEYKPNRKLIEDIQDELLKKKMILENGVRTGKINQEAYIKLLEKNHQNDQALFKVYSQLGVSEFAQFIQARICIIGEELNELKGIS